MLRKRFCLKEYEIVSFDIFDTLIERKVLVPQQLFVIVGKRVLGEDLGYCFCKDRVNAEKVARSKSGTGEVYLSDIYNSLDGYDEVRDKLMSEEISVELEMCRGKNRGLELLKTAKENSQRVILISDMYMPSSVLMGMLQKCGVEGVDKLYVSCEYGCSKRTGGLFKEVLSSEKILPNKIVHVGDDYIADVKGASKNGVSSVWLVDFKCIMSKIIQKLGICL